MRGSATSFLRYRQKKFYSKHKLPSFHIKTILIRTYIWPLTLLVCRAKVKGGLNTFSSTSTSIMHMTICRFRSWLAYTDKSLQISSLGAFCFIIFSVLFFMLLVIKDFLPNFQILWSSKTWLVTIWLVQFAGPVLKHESRLLTRTTFLGHDKNFHVLQHARLNRNELWYL